MKITSIGTVLLRLPYRQSGPPAGFGGKVWITLDTLPVRVDTDTDKDYHRLLCQL